MRRARSLVAWGQKLGRELINAQPKADLHEPPTNVRYWTKADKGRFWAAPVCPLMTHKRLSARSASEADYFIHTSPLHLAADTLLQAEAELGRADLLPTLI